MGMGMFLLFAAFQTNASSTNLLGKGKNQGTPLEPRQGDSPAPLFRTAVVTLH